MSIDKEIWQPPFRSELPRWQCPTCQTGTLEIIQDTLKVVETGASQRERDKDFWSVDCMCFRFSCLLTCNIKRCREIVTVCGEKYVEMKFQYSQNYEENYDDLFIPLSIYPAISIFDIPEGLPGNVEYELNRSFSLYWQDQNAAANVLRIAIEKLMTELGIPGTKANGKPFSLHHRLNEFGRSRPKLKENLLALKRIGNHGSHERYENFQHDDLIDAFEVFAFVLDKLYPKPDQEGRVNELTMQINKRDGRPKSKS